jgi:MFS family permease
VLVLSGLTATLVVAMPAMSMPVLFPEMSVDLGLSLVQIGAIWGTGSLAGMFTSLVGGSVGDRFGTKRTLAVACFLVGLAGALRAAASNFATLGLAVFVAGLLGPFISTNLHKTCGMWFSKRRLGLANGVVAAGMAFGFMSGSMVSATVLSPWLGSWRRVMLLYGAIGAVMSIPWLLVRSGPAECGETVAGGAEQATMRQALSRVAKVRGVWLLGLMQLGVGGCINAMLGYIPSYLREVGWTPALADGALASFHAMSLISVLPLALLSDRLGSRKRFLAVAVIMITVGVALLSVAQGPVVWLAVMLAGLVRDGFMAIYMTTITELEGVGPMYTGTAIGLAATLSRLGGLLAPPLGNSLANWDLRWPFVFWAALSVLGFVALLFVAEGKSRGTAQQASSAS